MGREFHMFPVTARSSDKMDKYGDAALTFVDTVFGFWDDVQAPPENSSSSSDSLDDDGDDYDHDEKVEGENLFSLEKNKVFWEEQGQLLQATLRRTSSIETRIRQATKEALRELNNASDIQCFCRLATVAKGCRNCLRREICDRLVNLGYNCAISKSNWSSSSEIPAGEHTYLEVVDKSNTKRGEVKVIIELNFRAEFEMARANQEYNKLITRLPEVFVGKAERLRVLIKIMCSAAKKCMKEKNMHLGPWRKHNYMQAKWFGKNNKNNDFTSLLPLPTTVYSASRPHKPKASMLTYDLLENIPSLHCSAVEVV